MWHPNERCTCHVKNILISTNLLDLRDNKLEHCSGVTFAFECRTRRYSGEPFPRINNSDLALYGREINDIHTTND